MCSRVWSAGVERKKSVEGGRTFMECQEHPFHKGKLPAARDRSPCGNKSALHGGFWPQILPQDVCQIF